MKIKKGTMFYSKANGWCYQYFQTRPDGSRRRRMLCAKTEEALLDRIYALDKDLAVITSLDDWIKFWQNNYVAQNVKPRTLKYYKNLAKYLPESILRKRLEDLDTADFQSLFTIMLQGSGKGKEKKQPLSPTTVRSFRSMLISAIGAAHDAGYVYRNVVKATKPPRQNRQEKIALTAEQARHFIEIARGKNYYKPYTSQDEGQKYFSDEIAVLVETALRTGLRPGEVFGLRWECVDADKKKIKINASLGAHSHEGRFELGETKTVASTRTISVEAYLTDLLTDLKNRQAEYAAKLGDNFKNPDGLIFTGIFGGPIDINNFRSRHWKALCKAADVPTAFTPHCMRHTFITLALQAGMNVKAVSKYAGHTNVAFTMKVYAHVLDEMESEVPSALGALLSDEKNIKKK